MPKTASRINEKQKKISVYIQLFGRFATITADEN